MYIGLVVSCVRVALLVIIEIVLISDLIRIKRDRKRHEAYRKEVEAEQQEMHTFILRTVERSAKWSDEFMAAMQQKGQ